MRSARSISIVLLSLLFAGCAPTLRGPAARPAEGLLVADDHSPTSALVFENPSVSRYHATLSPRSLPESHRRDASLGMGPRPIPVRSERPSLERARRTTLPRTARELILF
ncbi:MAG: hypothetical protein AAGI53_05395 [Planctomycetota bacterium]